MKKKSVNTKKSIPHFKTDEEAEAFLKQDLSDYLHEGNFRPVTFEFETKSDKLNMRLPSSLMTAIKKQAKRAKMPYQRYIRQVLERDLRGE